MKLTPVPRGVQWLIGLGLLILLGLGGRSCYQRGQQANQWEAKAKAAVARADTVLARSDTLKALAAQAVAKADSEAAISAGYARSAARSKAKADSLATVAAGLPASESGPVWRDAFLAERGRSDSLQAALDAQVRASGALRLALGIATERADTLESALRANTTVLRDRPKPCRVLGLIACPSRGAMLLTGLVLGAGVTLIH